MTDAARNDEELSVDLVDLGEDAAGATSDGAGGKKKIISRGPWQIMWMKLRRDRIALFGGVILIGLYSLAIFAGFFSPYSYRHQFRDTAFQPPVLLWSDSSRRVATERFVAPDDLIDALEARDGGLDGLAADPAEVIFWDDWGEEAERARIAAVEMWAPEGEDGEEVEASRRLVVLAAPRIDATFQGAELALAEDDGTNYTVEATVPGYVDGEGFASGIHWSDDEGNWTRPYVTGFREVRVLDSDLDDAGEWIGRTRPDPSRKFPIYLFHEGAEKDEYSIPIVSWITGHLFRTHLFGIDADLYLEEDEAAGRTPIPGVVYLFGSDNYGRDVFSRLLYGAQISLSVGLLGIAISMSLGMLVGGISGFYADRRLRLVELPAIGLAIVVFATPFVAGGEVLRPAPFDVSETSFLAGEGVPADIVGQTIIFRTGKNLGDEAKVLAFDAESGEVRIDDPPTKQILKGDAFILKRDAELDEPPKVVVDDLVRIPDLTTKPIVLGLLLLLVLPTLIGTRSLGFRIFLCIPMLVVSFAFVRYGVLAEPTSTTGFFGRAIFHAGYWLAAVPSICWLTWRVEKLVEGTPLGDILLFDKLPTVDFVIMRVIEVILAVPGLYLILTLRFAFGTEGVSSTMSYVLIVLILAFIGWASNGRVIRGMVLSIREREFVVAARALGVNDFVIIVKHILPNTLSYVIVTATLYVPYYILGEVALSFLGVGIQEPESSWGLMLKDAQNVSKLKENPWLIVPGFFIFAAVLAYNFLGDGLRDAADPRTVVAAKPKS